MRSGRHAAPVAAGILALLVCFQLLLAAGLPLGRAAWGGGHRVLPSTLRLSSLVAAVILAAAAWAVLARADRVGPGSDSTFVRIAVWVLGAYFALNTVMNILSQSPAERWLMAPVAAVLAVCFFLVALAVADTR
jgi:hypothetical protein